MNLMVVKMDSKIYIQKIVFKRGGGPMVNGPAKLLFFHRINLLLELNFYGAFGKSGCFLQLLDGGG